MRQFKASVATSNGMWTHQFDVKASQLHVAASRAVKIWRSKNKGHHAGTISITLTEKTN